MEVAGWALHNTARYELSSSPRLSTAELVKREELYNSGAGQAGRALQQRSWSSILILVFSISRKIET
jgi:hypothetical protein